MHNFFTKDQLLPDLFGILLNKVQIEMLGEPVARLKNGNTVYRKFFAFREKGLNRLTEVYTNLNSQNKIQKKVIHTKDIALPTSSVNCKTPGGCWVFDKRGKQVTSITQSSCLYNGSYTKQKNINIEGNDNLILDFNMFYYRGKLNRGEVVVYKKGEKSPINDIGIIREGGNFPRAIKNYIEERRQTFKSPKSMKSISIAKANQSLGMKI